MDNNATAALLLQLTSTLAQVADKKEPYQEQKWVLTIIAFAVSGAAVVVTILSHIVSNRCWNMLSPTTKSRMIQDKCWHQPVRDDWHTDLAPPTSGSACARPSAILSSSFSRIIELVYKESQRLSTEAARDQLLHGGLSVPDAKESFISIVVNRVGSQFQGNEIRGTSYWKLLFGEPELRVPVFGDGFFIDLAMLAGPPQLIDKPEEAESEDWCRTPQHMFMISAPNNMRCSAYTLAETVNQARLLRIHDLLDVNPFWLEQAIGTRFPRELFPVKYEFIKVSSDGIIDTGTTYGVRIAFADYWATLTSTRTKWSTFKHSSGSDGLVATSVWGTMRMWLQEILQLLNFIPHESGSLDSKLFGWGYPAADPNVYSGLESIWKMWRKMPQTLPAVYHLFYSQLSTLELAVDALINVISTHIPSTSRFSGIWSDAPHGTSIALRDEANDSTTRLLNLRERCKCVLDCWNAKGAMSQRQSTSSDPSPGRIAKYLALWKEKDVPTLPTTHDHRLGYPKPAIPCEQHSCVCIESDPAGQARKLTEHSAQKECAIGLFLSSVFSDPGEGILRNIPRRLVLDTNDKPVAELTKWKEGVVVGCLEMIHRIHAFCEDVRVIPEVAESIRPWEWRTAYIV